MPQVLLRPGLPGPRYPYAALIRRCPGLVTYWPGQSNASSSVANYAMPTTAWTMEIWFKITTAGTNLGIFSNWSTNGPVIWLDVSGSGQIAIHVNASDVGSGVIPASATWYYVAAMYDGTNRLIYVNGTLKGGPTSGITPVQAATPLITQNYAGSGAGDWVGQTADAAVYSRALSPGEVYQHYIAGLPRV